MTALPATWTTPGEPATRWREVTSPPPGYIDLREAVRRAAASDHYTGSRKPLTVKMWLYRLAEQSRGEPVCAVMVAGKLYLPTSLHPALHIAPPAATADDMLASLRDGPRHRAALKLAALRDLDAFARSPEGRALGRVRSRAEFCSRRAGAYSYREGRQRKQLALTVRSLERWESLYRHGGLSALAADGRGSGGGSAISQAAVDLFNALYHSPKKQAIARIHYQVAAESERRGWQWFNTLAACRAWARRAIDQRAAVLFRDGEEAYRKKCEPYITPDPESFAPGACWMSDHSAANCWVRLANGRVVRPFLTVWQDWRTRTIVDATLGVVGTQEQILVSFRNAARAYGLPETVQLDNGKDYSSYLWTGGRPKRMRHKAPADLNDRVGGLFNLLSINCTWGQPYNPNSKARVEAWFRHFDAFCKLFDSYCGNAPENRPDAHTALVERAVGIDEFRTKLAEWVDVYNNAPHGASDMHGFTPLQALSQAPSKRVLTDAQADALLCCWPREVKVQRNGVTIRIAGEALTYGRFDAALQRLAIGTPVRVAYDPTDHSSVSVWSVDGKFICRAEENHGFNRSVSNEELREAHREKSRAKRALRAARDAGRIHLTDAYTMALAGQHAAAAKSRLPDPPTGEGPALKPVQTAIEAPSKERQDLRRRAGSPDVIADAQQRLADFAKRSAADRKQRRAQPPVDPLVAWAQKEAASA